MNRALDRRPRADTAPRFPWFAACAGLLALAPWLVACGGDGGGRADGTLSDATDVGTGCLPDGDDTPDRAHALSPGAPAEGLVCPVADRDWYRIDGAQVGDLAQVLLERDAAVSAVDLRYTVYAADGATPLGSGSDADGADGPARVDGAHRVPVAGAIYVEVRDEGGDDQDRFGAYRLTVSLLPDPDPNEPNGDADGATALADGATVQGALSERGDEDWFRVAVPAGAPRRVAVAVHEPVGAPTELAVRLVAPDGAEIGRAAADYDDDAPANVAVTWAAKGAGDHFVVVSDRDGDELDVEARYAVSVTLSEDPDPAEAGAGDDTPETATALADGGPVGGRRIAARADQDWFVFEAPEDAWRTRPYLLDLTVAPEGDALAIDLAVALFAPDPDTPCEPGDACESLATQNARGCVRHADCRSHACRDDGSCVGGGFCLPGGCAVARWLGSLAPEDPDAARGLTTVLPIDQPGPHWLVVRDRQDQAWDDAGAYRVAVALTRDPDPHEPDGAWQPGADEALDREGWPVSARRATDVPYTIAYRDGTTREGWHADGPRDVVDAGSTDAGSTDTGSTDTGSTDAGSTDAADAADADGGGAPDAIPPFLPSPEEIARLSYAPMEGWISFEADEDWYRLHVPEELADAADGAWLRLDWRVSVDYAYEGDTIQPFWTVLRGDLPRVHASWTTPPLPAAGVLGDGGGDLDGDGATDCLYLCHLVGRPLWLRVTDFGRARTDRETPYRFQVTLTPGCPEECDCARNCPE